MEAIFMFVRVIPNNKGAKNTVFCHLVELVLDDAQFDKLFDRSAMKEYKTCLTYNAIKYKGMTECRKAWK